MLLKDSIRTGLKYDFRSDLNHLGGLYSHPCMKAQTQKDIEDDHVLCGSSESRPILTEIGRVDCVANLSKSRRNEAASLVHCMRLPGASRQFGPSWRPKA